MKLIRETLKVLCIVGMVAPLLVCSSSDDSPIDIPGNTTSGTGGTGRPIIASVVPQSGSVNGGTVVSVRGQRLSGIITASLAGIAADILSRSDAELVLLSNPHPDKTRDTTGDVVVTTSTGSTDFETNGWTYLAEVGRSAQATQACPPFWPAEDPDLFIPEEYGLTDDDINCDWDGDGVAEGASFSFNSVRISGTNLILVDGTPGTSSVALVGVPVEQVVFDHEFTAVGDTVLFVDPAPFNGDETTFGFITVQTSGGNVTNSPSSQDFAYIVDDQSPNAPNASAVSPATVSASGEVSVTVTGINLSDVTEVQFVNSNFTAKDADVTVIDDTQVTVTVPPYTSQIVGDQVQGPVTVVDSSQVADPTPVFPFTYRRVMADAVCTSMSPSAGTDGTVITITGSDLGDPFTDVTRGHPVALAEVFIDDGNIPLLEAPTYQDTNADGRSEQVRFSFPTGQCLSGTFTIELRDEFGTVLTNCQSPFNFTAGFSVNALSLSPTSGAFEGGTFVEVTGCALNDVTNVTICGQPATGLTPNADGTGLTFQTPPSPTGGFATCDVQFFAGVEQELLEDAFTYQAGLPDGQTMQPNVGPLCGGTQFRMFGENLTGVDSVQVGANQVGTQKSVTNLFVNQTGTELLGITPSFSEFPALAPIVMEVTAEDTTADPDEVDPTPVIFVYANPTLTTVETCKRGGVDSAILVGQGFRDPQTGRNLVETVNVGGTSVPATVLSSTQISFPVPDLATGDYNVSVGVFGDDSGCYANSAPTVSMRIFTTEVDATCAPNGCTDGVDTDGRGDGIDCSDSTGECACNSGAECQVDNLCHETDCRDSTGGSNSDGDNDDDGLINCLDSDCPCGVGSQCDTGGTPPVCAEFICNDFDAGSNGIDNDGDGLANCDDTDCEGLTCNDTFACTTGDTCTAGACVAVNDDTLCDDLQFCNGTESCDPTDPGADADGCYLSRVAPCGADNSDGEGCIDDQGQASGAGCICDETNDVCREDQTGGFCLDGQDNDGDGDADCNDPDNDCDGNLLGEACFGCIPGNDDDGDGFTVPADPDCCMNCTPGVDCNTCGGCVGDSDCGGREANRPTNAGCTNGVDGDGDGLIDEADPDCCDRTTIPAGASADYCMRPCENEDDDNGDGFADNYDLGCIDTVNNGVLAASEADGCIDLNVGLDGDIFTDEADPDCCFMRNPDGTPDNAGNANCMAPSWGCADGRDNDQDVVLFPTVNSPGNGVDCGDLNCCVYNAQCPVNVPQSPTNVCGSL